jgi:ComF family protein
VFVWGRYQDALKRAIAALKYDNQPQIARSLGQWLGRSWLNSSTSCINSRTIQGLIVVPIPLHAARQQQRGYNQAELLAESFCRWTRLPLQRHGLARVRATEAQFALLAGQRESNLENAFKISPTFQKPSSTRVILLLDDIYTTGATVRSAAQTLQQAGIKVAGVVAVAQAQQIIHSNPT